MIGLPRFFISYQPGQSGPPALKERINQMPDENDKGAEGLQKKLEKFNGDALALATDLWADNYKFREQAREAKAKLEETEKKLPAEGAVVLTKADAERWKAYQELGKPEEIKAAVAERDTLKTENATVKREQTLRDVADVQGWNYSVIKRLADGLEFEIVDGKDKDGKAVKSANVVIVTGDKRESKPAAEYAEKEWSEFLPSLQKPSESERQEGTRFVKQANGKTQPPATREENVKAQRERMVSSNKYQI